jgi:hypothetical protein
MFMAKEKVTLTLDVDLLRELRLAIGARSLSATVDRALRAYLARVRHFRAVDEWLAEMEREDGPISPETKAWAAKVFDDWEKLVREQRGRAE